MGAKKTKINKNILNVLVDRTQRTPKEIKTMYEIFLQHFPSGKIESPQDLWRCLQKFSLVPFGQADPKAVDRLYRLFDAQNPNEQDPRHDGTIDFVLFTIVSHVLEHGTPTQKITLYFESLDIDRNRLITREDLERSLPPTVESQQLIQQLLKQWDMNKDGVVSFDDFERFIMTNPDLIPMFASAKDRVRLDSLTPASNNPPTPRNIFITSQ